MKKTSVDPNQLASGLTKPADLDLQCFRKKVHNFDKDIHSVLIRSNMVLCLHEVVNRHRAKVLHGVSVIAPLF